MALTSNTHRLPAFRCLISLLTVILLASCGPSTSEEKAERQKKQSEERLRDSLALKVAVTPTLDCLPFFVARECGIFDTLGVEVNLKNKSSQIDCDEAMRKGEVECMVSDLMRTERMRSLGTPLHYLGATNAYWQMIGNRKARIKDIKSLGDKMVAMTRYSATDYLATLAIDSVKPSNPVFRIQVNDVHVRLMMLLNNEMDAVLLPEPQASEARRINHPVLMDSREKGIHLGVIAAHTTRLADERRQQQINLLTQGYDIACDSINTYGLAHYSAIIKKYCHVKNATVKALPPLSYPHLSPPRQRDIDRTRNVKWRTS
jgi:NitT/TauT family transport system substrate-binding protein